MQISPQTEPKMLVGILETTSIINYLKLFVTSKAYLKNMQILLLFG